MKTLKEYIAPAVTVLKINTEYTMLAGSVNTETTDPRGNVVPGGPKIGEGSGSGPGAKPYTPWEENDEW